MTVREVYEAILIELTKSGAPDLMLDEFNYYINKGIYHYANKRYNVFDTNQQTTDDLQVLNATALLTGDALRHIGTVVPTPAGVNLTQAKYEVILPKNYYHLLNCILTYQLTTDYQCYNAGYQIQMPAKRLTADMYASIMNNAFQKPDYKRPYYFIKESPLTVKGDWDSNDALGDDMVKTHIQKAAGDETAHNAWKDNNADSQLTGADEFVGPSMQLNYGRDNSIFSLVQVDVNYLKVPSRIRITPEQIDATVDNSQLMEFPEYVNRQIIKEIIGLLRLRNSDPRMQAHEAVEASIPSGMGQQQAKQ